jgi:hypothetical protein
MVEAIAVLGPGITLDGRDRLVDVADTPGAPDPCGAVVHPGFEGGRAP